MMNRNELSYWGATALFITMSKCSIEGYNLAQHAECFGAVMG